MTPALSTRGTVSVAGAHGRQQPVGELVDLVTRIAQPGDRHQGVGTQPQHGAGRQTQQIDAVGREVLAQVTRTHLVAYCSDLIEELAADQMHLAQVGLVRIVGDARAMLHSRARVSIAFHAQPGHQRDLALRVLGEPMVSVQMDRDNSCKGG